MRCDRTPFFLTGEMADRSRFDFRPSRYQRKMSDRELGIYLNDHPTGATGVWLWRGERPPTPPTRSKGDVEVDRARPWKTA